MLSLEQSINDDNKKEEFHNKTPIKCIGILFLLIILITILFLILIIIMRKELKNSIDKINDERKDLKKLINELNNEKNELQLKVDKINIEKNDLKNVTDIIIYENKQLNSLINNQIDVIEKLIVEKNEIKKLIDKKEKELKNITNMLSNNNIQLFIEKEEFKNNISYIENDLNTRINEIENEKNKLKNRTNIIQDENNELKSRVNKLENEMIELKKSIDIIDAEKDNLKNRIDEIENEKNERNKYYNNLFTESNVIKVEERKIISKWILPHYNLKFELLFSGSIDGFSDKVFHSKCDNKGPTVFVAKLENNRRVGGFTSKSWNTNVVGQVDANAFLFSLDNKIKYGQKNKGREAIYGQSYTSVLFGPNFDENPKGDDLLVQGQKICCRADGAKYNFKKEDLCGNDNCKFMNEFEVYLVS